MFKSSMIYLVKQTCVLLKISSSTCGSIIQRRSSISVTQSTVKFAFAFHDVRNNNEKNLPSNFIFQQALTVTRTIKVYVNSIELLSINKLKGHV